MLQVRWQDKKLMILLLATLVNILLKQTKIRSLRNEHDCDVTPTDRLVVIRSDFKRTTAIVNLAVNK